MENSFERVFLLRVYLLKLKHQILSSLSNVLNKIHEKRLWESCIGEVYTLTKKGNAFADIFQQISLDFKQFLMVFFNSKKSCLTEIIQMTYLVIHEISCRYFFNDSFCKCVNDLFTTSLQFRLETDGQPWNFSKYILLIKEVECWRHIWIL